jgi:hypothetical protein
MEVFPLHIWELIVSNMPFHGNLVTVSKHMFQVVLSIEKDRILKIDEDRTKGFFMSELCDKYWFSLRELGWVGDDRHVARLKRLHGITIKGWKQIIMKEVDKDTSYWRILDVMNLSYFGDFDTIREYLLIALVVPTISRSIHMKDISTYFERLYTAGLFERIIEDAGIISDRFGYEMNVTKFTGDVDCYGRSILDGFEDFLVEVIIGGNPVLMEYFVDYNLIPRPGSDTQFWHFLLTKASKMGRWDIIKMCVDKGVKYDSYYLSGLVQNGFPDVVIKVLDEGLIKDKVKLRMIMLSWCYINLEDRTLECNGVVVGSLDTYLKIQGNKKLPHMHNANVDQLHAVYHHIGLKHITKSMIFELADDLFHWESIQVCKNAISVLKDVYITSEEDDERYDPFTDSETSDIGGDSEESDTSDGILNFVSDDSEPTIITMLKEECMSDTKEDGEMQEKWFHAWLENWRVNIVNEFGV